MKLRSYFLIFTIMGLALVMFPIEREIQSLFAQNFELLDKKQQTYISQIVKSVVKTKESQLRTFARIFDSDNDFGSIFMLSIESGDNTVIQEELEKIKKKLKIDYIDVLSLDNTFSVVHEKIIPTNRTRKIISSKHPYFYEFDEKLFIVIYQPIYLYNSKIGTLALGYDLNRRVGKYIDKLTDTHVIFSNTKLSKAEKGFKIYDSEVNNLYSSISIKHPSSAGLDEGLVTQLFLIGSIGVLILLFIFYLFLEVGFLQGFQSTLKTILDYSEGLEKGVFKQVKFPHFFIRENKSLAKAIKKLTSSLEEFAERAKEKAIIEEDIKKQKALNDFARQVAHDIKSPLSALSVMGSKMTELPNDQRKMLKSAVTRIQDITNSLSKTYKSQASFKTPEAINSINNFRNKDTLSSSIMLALPIENLVSEKRLEFKTSPSVEIVFDKNRSNIGLFSCISIFDLQRILSNLINNSVEALDGKGKVFVDLYEYNNKISIDVVDTGKGIPKEHIKKVLEKGATFGKKNGSGLGLHHARQVIEQYGGEIKIFSKEDLGTKVQILLKKQNKASWYLMELQLSNIDTLVLIDDDDSIHQIWDNKLESVLQKIPQLKIVHLFTPDDARDWVKKNADIISNCFFLVDFEYKNSRINGLNLMKEFAILQRSVLVSSHADEAEIVDKCSLLGVKVLPKSLIPFMTFIIPENRIPPPDLSQNQDNVLH